MTFLEERDYSDVPTMLDYYKGKTIFITGGSGFLGKALVEKLLYSCPNLDRIYLLMRSKKGVEPADRLKALYNQHCFTRLRETRPGVFENKVFFIAGDIAEKGLGMSEEDRTLIINRTNIILHSAASVRFDDNLKKAVTLNIKGTLEMLELAKEVRNLESFIHISTSYANTNRDIIKEQMYPPLANWREVIDISDTMDSHMLHVLTPKFLGEMPNTYVFTKQLTEQMVYEQRGKLPIVIVRPSIVIASYSEPTPGWIDNFNGPVGILVAGGKGVLRTIYTDPKIISDYIPVDVVVKGILVTAWARGTKTLESSDDIPIYNMCAGEVANISVEEIIRSGLEEINKAPFLHTFRPPKVQIEKSKFMYKIKVFLYHLLPAIAIDIVLRVLEKKPMLVKIQRKIYNANVALEYYLTHQWKFNNDNFLRLSEKIKPDDQDDFYYSFDGVDPMEYYKSCIAASRKYLLNETEEDMERALKTYKRGVIVDTLLRVLFYGCLLWWFLNLDFVKKILLEQE